MCRIVRADIYDEMYNIQEGRCAICNEHSTNNKKLVVDHNHRTNKVRKLLCRECNLGIGYLRESEKILSSAISYLKNI